MVAATVVPTAHIDASAADPATRDMIRRAQAADDADRALTIKQALRRYPVAVFWSMFLSLALVMDGFDIVVIGSFYGQTQFKQRFGDQVIDGVPAISATWQSGLSNASLCGQILGLAVNAWTQDRFGCRPTMLFFLVWNAAALFIPLFANSLGMLAAGEVLCGISWGTFQTLTTAYASEVVPTVLRPYVTAYVCMCWGLGITISSAVVRAVVNVPGDWGWRLPFVLQMVWPPLLFLGTWFAPESPWNAVRRGRTELALRSLNTLKASDETESDAEAKLAYIQYTTELETAETAGASFLDCFRGTNLRRTEINCVVWAAQILCGNAILGYSVVFLERAGFSEVHAFDVNISLSICYLVGGVVSWFLMARLGRATIYMGGLAFMFVCLLATGGLGWASPDNDTASIAIGVLLVIQTLFNMCTIGPLCYPIVAETPSGKLRYKTIVIGRVVYNLVGIFNNSVTPRMIDVAAWSGLFYAGTNLLCLIWCWFRLPETKDRSFGEIDVLFENHVPARKFKYTKADQFAQYRDAVAADHVDDEKKADVEHLEMA
ncbi:hypothetical protein Q5752_000369 [Cryptotrichosporon argae]